MSLYLGYNTSDASISGTWLEWRGAALLQASNLRTCKRVRKTSVTKLQRLTYSGTLLTRTSIIRLLRLSGLDLYKFYFTPMVRTEQSSYTRSFEGRSNHAKMVEFRQSGGQSRKRNNSANIDAICIMIHISGYLICLAVVWSHCSQISEDPLYKLKSSWRDGESLIDKFTPMLTLLCLRIWKCRHSCSSAAVHLT